MRFLGILLLILMETSCIECSIEETVSSAVSPGGDYLVEVNYANCHATEPYMTRVVLTRMYFAGFKRSTLIAQARRERGISAKWIGPNLLKVNCVNCTEDYYAIYTKWGDITIQYDSSIDLLKAK